uniref:Uncharacterized protein n=1 Tax=Salmonella phage vB_SE130_2P TaxID=3236707 RepID=A0AB39C4M2_9VIRU
MGGSSDNGQVTVTFKVGGKVSNTLPDTRGTVKTQQFPRT